MSALLDYDTGPLNWVRGDIDAALQAALGRIQAYSIDLDLTNALRLAGDDAHQVAGALRMVGLEGAATLAGALESCLADINENRLRAGAELLRALRNAMEGLQRWVKDLADGRGSGELALFPLYKRLRELQGVERVFEGELFFPDLRARAQGKGANAGLTQEALAAEVKSARGQFQRGLLAFLRNVEAEQGLKRMRDALAAIERIAPSQAWQSFWWACVGFVDSLIAHGIEADFHVKQVLARVDLQMRRLMEGSPQVTERLMRDALFFVAKSQALDGRAAEIRSTLGLDRYLPGRGMLDPEALARMRPVLDALQAGLKAARDSWHAYVEGDAGQMEQFQAHLAHMQPQAQMLEKSGLKPLLDELAAAASAAAGRAGEQKNLEVASALLFLQNAIDQEDILHADFAARAAAQQGRLRALIEGREMPASAVDSNSQREAERDMLVHMAQEVGQNLKQMEEALDAFFRNADEREALAGLPELAQQAQGALTMLELPDAASLLAAATATVQPFVSAGHPDVPTQQRLADAFSSLGLFIEAFCAGRADAARILRPILIDFGLIDGAAESTFDDNFGSGRDGDEAKKKFLGELTELQGDAAPTAAAAATRSQDAVAVLSGLGLTEQATESASWALELIDPVAGEAAVPPPAVPAAKASGSSEPIEVLSFASDASLIGGFVEPAHPPHADVLEFTSPTPTVAAAPAAPVSRDSAPTGAPGLVSIPEGVERELLDIFLEEAKDVLATMGEAADACRDRPDDQETLTVVRRAFHTLKGSGRMVGLNDLGETAWRLEQLMNGWLAEQKPASSDLLHVVGQARSVFQDWVNALQAGRPEALPVSALLAAVDRVAKGLPLDDAQATGSETDAQAPAAIELTPHDAFLGGEPAAGGETGFAIELDIDAGLDAGAGWSPLPIIDVEFPSGQDETDVASESEGAGDDTEG